MSARVFGGCRALMAAASASGATSRARSAATKVAASKPRGAGITKPAPISPALKKFVGAPEISRADAIRKIWEHIKLNQLQNPANKREIFCDEKLKSIFDGRDKVGMLEIAKFLSPHFPKSN